MRTGFAPNHFPISTSGLAIVGPATNRRVTAIPPPMVGGGEATRAREFWAYWGQNIAPNRPERRAVAGCYRFPLVPTKEREGGNRGICGQLRLAWTLAVGPTVPTGSHRV